MKNIFKKRNYCCSSPKWI